MKAGDRCGFFGQQIHDFTFAFITPLTTQHDNILTHNVSLKVTQ
ncbi:hypothetical protein AO381_0327 [Moraxella catarrhalis]|nr:hypothetical protein AO381_0327 [Moraxella catarrhalis]